MQFVPGTHERVHPVRGWCWYCGEVTGVSQKVASRFKRWMQRAWRAAGLSLLFLTLTVPLPLQAANFPGEQPTYDRETGFEMAFFYVSGGNGDGQVEYICQAFPGTTGSDDLTSSVWQVRKFTYDSSNRISTIQFAGDNDAYDQVCANRTSLNYN